MNMSNAERAADAYDRADRALRASTLRAAAQAYGDRRALRLVARRYPELKKRYERLSETTRYKDKNPYTQMKRADFVEDFEFILDSSPEVPTRLALQKRFGVEWESIRVRLARAGRIDLARRVPSDSQREREYW